MKFETGKSYRCKGGEIVTIEGERSPGMTMLRVRGLDGRTDLEMEGPTTNIAGFLLGNEAVECETPEPKP